MELKMETMQIVRRKSQAVSQITFDSDCNVPDVKPDIGRLIQNKGAVTLEEVRISEGKAFLKGFLQADLLYVGEQEGELKSFSAKLGLEEALNLEGLSGGDKVCLKWEIEDISIHMINSRKVNIKAVVTFFAEAAEIKGVQVPIALEQSNISMKRERKELLSIKIHKKDTLRVREEVLLASNRPNVKKLLWYILDVRSMEYRLEKEQLRVNGEVSAFVIYEGEGGGNAIQWVEYTLPFSECLECGGCEEGLISHIESSVLQQNLEVKPDTDGEERVFLADLVLEFDIKLYKERGLDVLLDVYTPEKECILSGRKEMLNRLLIRNFSRCRVNDRLELKEMSGKVLQLCYTQGRVKIDQSRIVEKGILAEGIVQLKILYVMGNDALPFYSMDAAIPFSHLVEAQGIHGKDPYYLNAELEQISAVMVGNKEIEIRASVNLNTLVLSQEEIFLMEQIEEKEWEKEMLRTLPGILVYMVKPGEELWDIAKKHFTTIEEICMLNELTEEKVNPGQPLLLTKKSI